MEKMRFETKNITDENIQKILELFPNVATEAIGDNGKLKTAIDFEKLKQELSEVVIDGEESYDFTWVGKKEAMIEANRPIRKTLRPDRESSVDWENTQNIYIEGDNLEALKLLQESYLGKVKMIYIDPPYNTGNDFIYNDTFSMDKDDYEEEIEYKDEDGNINFKKNETSNPRYHSDWCSMIYSRLKLARNLLSDDGVIFISIDDNEVTNLKKLCDEIFGSFNFIADLIWTNKEGGGSSDSKLYRIKHEHVLVFSKNIDSIEILGVPVSNEDRYKSFDEYESTRGKYYLQKMGMGTIQYSESLDYPIEAPDGSIIYPKDNNNGKKACWRWSKPKYDWGVLNGFIEIKKDSNNIWTVYTKQYLNCDNEGNIIKRTQRPMGVIDSYSSTQASKFLDSIGLGNVFSYSKPQELLCYLIERINTAESIILDFFSGSATTAHAIMQLNAQDGGNRKFIMVQLPEKTDEKSEAYKAGYLNICEIGKERIRRTGKKIQEENHDKKIDIGFRVFKVDDTNMNDVYYMPSELQQGQLGLLESNIKSDRTDEDLLYGCLLDWGIELSLPHKVEIFDGKRVHIVDYNPTYTPALIACFEDQVSESVMRKIAEMKPTRVVFKDGSFVGDANKINVEEIFKLISPETTVKVI